MVSIPSMHDLPATTSEADLLKLIDELNTDPAIHGILVQLPLPEHMNSTKILGGHQPGKGCRRLPPGSMSAFSRSARTERALVPCTPAGSLVLVEKAAAALGVTLDGMNAVIVGRSNIVGKPMVQLLLSKNMTVDDRPFEDQGSRGGRARGRSRRRGGRSARDGQGRLDQAGRHRDRRGHQPHSRAKA